MLFLFLTRSTVIRLGEVVRLFYDKNEEQIFGKGQAVNSRFASSTDILIVKFRAFKTK